MSYELSNVSAGIDSVQIKKELAKKGLRALDIDIREDMCTQKKFGTAELKVRDQGVGTEAALKSALSEIGIAVEPKAPIAISRCADIISREFNRAPRNNDWSDTKLEGKDKELAVGHIDCRRSTTKPTRRRSATPR